MAEIESRRPENVPGKFYVDDNCVACGLCWITARANFGHDAEKRAFITKQPETDEEWNECYEALSDCPVQAVGDDGDQAKG